MGMLGENLSIKMAILGGRLQAGENKYMMLEALEEYALYSAEAAYE